MAAVGLALVRRLAPASNFGHITSKLSEHPILSQGPYMRSPCRSVHSSKMLYRRSLFSQSPLQSQIYFAGQASGPWKARIDRKREAEKNTMDHESCEVKPCRALLEQRQTSATKFLSCRKSSMDYDEDKTSERKSSNVKLECQSELTEELGKPSAYVTPDFVDYRAMQLVFLGTSSSIPTSNRSTSCVALRLDGSIFLFDCGEGAVRQILKTPMKHYDISKIFITHMHGDHDFLVDRYMACQEGLLCRIGLKEFKSKKPIQIYGPQGLRQWIRSTLKASHARVHPKYTVHEMMLKKKASNMARSWNFVEENHSDELPGQDIRHSSDGLWHIYEDDKYLVKASFLRHTIPCWGFVVEEHPRRGRFNVERALEAGVKPGRCFSMLETGDSVTLQCGKVVSPSAVLGPPRRGRKVVILGDTCDSKAIVAASKEADVVVHEATVLEQDESEVYKRGHSTAEMAGEFARTINAGTLVLTHFSRKLDGAHFVNERSHVRTTMKDLVSTAKQSFGKTSVIAAEDLMAITIQLVDERPVQFVNERYDQPSRN